MKRDRLIVYSADLVLVFGMNERTARKYLQTVKDALHKSRHQFVTFKELADYSGIPKEEILERCLG